MSKKKAVVYDKWLHSLGGGEVVACNIARLLHDYGYEVLFVSGKEVPHQVIYEKLNINLSDIKFTQIWNDELALKKITQDKDLFINISFMDFSRGFAKANVYYANFPTKAYENISGFLFSKIVLPIATHFIKPFESMHLIDAGDIIKGMPAYSLNTNNKYSLSNLNIGEVGLMEFSIYIENFSKMILEYIKVNLENGIILEKKISVDHFSNVLSFKIRFRAKSKTVYLTIDINQPEFDKIGIEKGHIYLLYPQIQINNFPGIIFSNLLQKINVRLRAGFFADILDRLKTYKTIFTYSNFSRKWIKSYWNRNAQVVAPPIDLLYWKYDLKKSIKKNWICSVGRFFTLGHGKKQEVLIEAFKKLYDQGKKNWELHLVGGLGDEVSSIEFFKYLKEQSKKYPIFFHISASREEVEDVYLKSKIYWHATGFGENEIYHPVRFEHFGIAPIEALSAKCIPLLFNGGGLCEIIDTVNLDRNRHLFSSIDELVNNTIYFQDELNGRLDWRFIFKQIDEQYSLSAFKNNLFKFLESLD